MNISRRHFLARAAAVGAGFAGLRRASATGNLWRPSDDSPFGPVLRDPARVCDLPEGFQYSVISRMGQTMADGLLVPGMADGMAAFPGPGGLTLIVRNHEVAGGVHAEGPFGKDLRLLPKADAARLFDLGGPGEGPIPGGTTTVVYDTRSRRLVREFLSLGGTERNCAGGPTPWGTWITCEETVSKPGAEPGTYDKAHGYCFEVRATAEPELQPARPIRAMGRFNHEACCVDPVTHAIYHTEDRGDGLLYRLLPDNARDLLAGGRLQVLRAVGRDKLDTRNWEQREFEPGASIDVEWLDLADAGIDIEPMEDTLRAEGFDAGAARFARGEGMWWGQVAGRASAFLACTNGGPAKVGQLWRYTPDRTSSPDPRAPRPGEGALPAESRGRLELFVESPSGSVMENADNITISPEGVLYVCEDGDGGNRLLAVLQDGRTFPFANNALSESELTGVCFSPDGTTMFVNIQRQGLTLAITGPWNRAG